MSQPEIPGWKHLSSGKVRDLYIPNSGQQDRILVVASDRISAYDYILPTEIPDKGRVLTQLSLWWFEQLADLTDNHVLADAEVPSQVAGRAMVVKRLRMYPIECVARGYLTGSGLVEYKQSASVCGVRLPAGLTEASKLPEAIYTPAAKAEFGEHDENISFAATEQLVGKEAASALREQTLAIYNKAAAIARQKGIIIADTKFEFGTDQAGKLILADEVLTPDSSRFWPVDKWQEGQVTPSFDKQYVRDWLTGPESGWDRASGKQPPALPQEVALATRARYVEAYETLTGRTFTA
ncbi:phosphoribosylaminoimidazolesuccinocarboxamide synthase [Winkia neuii]|uniref:phosphoribosylaminoimidazolesuccinocarboxamide synthase n=1 Tax=Winkia neuii TaxID=33007 RepID=UPI000763F983|nr:phosphoribosylaminoimidazolesuccinocarboxamide synthase [Winkia neuii]KWZ75202.1 phosphoribosylaminoimidazolesuccinocarboxamide synthase [Winkia neuii]